jgi:CheY-like chemotaxis protein
VNPETGLRILIVDDNHDFLAAARGVLEQDGLAIVGLASSSAEALQVAGEVQPDAILVDVDLGDESGFDLAHQLVAADHTSVLLISVYAESELSDLISSSAAVGFVAKAELSGRTVMNALGRSGNDLSSPNG